MAHSIEVVGGNDEDDFLRHFVKVLICNFKNEDSYVAY